MFSLGSQGKKVLDTIFIYPEDHKMDVLIFGEAHAVFETP